MAGDPADVGRAPERVVVLEVENPLAGQCRAQQVAAGRVQDSLRFAGRSRCVEDIERVLAVERLGRAIGRRIGLELVPPVIAAGRPVDWSARPAQDNDILEVGAGRSGGVGISLSGTSLPRR